MYNVLQMNTETESPPEDQLHQQAQEGLKDRSLNIVDEKRSTGYGPVLILDVDKGIDFTFEGMGLKGNR